jgi:hypothetical protein
MAFLMPIRDVVIEFLKHLFAGSGLIVNCLQERRLGKHALEVKAVFTGGPEHAISNT